MTSYIGTPPSDSSGPEPPPADCGISKSSSAITDETDSLAPPSAPHTTWSYEGENNHDPCADFSYALLVQQPPGNSQFGPQLLFFHQGEYIGIDSAYPQQVIRIEDRGSRLIVTYEGWEAREGASGPNAGASQLHRDRDLILGAHNGRVDTLANSPTRTSKPDPAYPG